MIRKFQQGGQAAGNQQQEEALMQFILGIAQVAQVDPQQVIQLAQQEPQRLESAVQVFQLTQDIQQAAQAFFQKEVQSAKRGAKLNYLKRLTGKCPEGEQLVYFKAGGRVCSKCMAKKKVEEIKCGKKMKKSCGGSKISFKYPGGIFRILKRSASRLSNKLSDVADDYMTKQWLEDNRKNGIYDEERILPDGTKITYNTGLVTPDSKHFNGYSGYWTIYNPDGTKRRVSAETDRGGGHNVGLFDENNDMIFHGPVRVNGFFSDEDEKAEAIRNRQEINNSLKKYGISFR